MDLMENEGMNKDGKLVYDKIHEHVEEQLDEFLLTFTIWFKPRKKEGVESTFSIGNIASVSWKINITFDTIVITSSRAKNLPAQKNTFEQQQDICNKKQHC